MTEDSKKLYLIQYFVLQSTDEITYSQYVRTCTNTDEVIYNSYFVACLIQLVQLYRIV